MGHISGSIHSADANPDAVTWSGWSATPQVVGVDGKTRRWVFLHVFKPQQPTLNWLDPSFAAERANYGDIARNIVDRGRNELAYMNRKRGGWTFQELNVSGAERSAGAIEAIHRVWAGHVARFLHPCRGR
jgi:hypothetical protein